MKRKQTIGDEQVDWFGIHEVFYDEEGKLSWTDNEMAPAGETLDELRESLERMLKALDKPVLDYDAEQLAELPKPGSVA